MEQGNQLELFPSHPYNKGKAFYRCPLCLTVGENWSSLCAHIARKHPRAFWEIEESDIEIVRGLPLGCDVAPEDQGILRIREEKLPPRPQGDFSKFRKESAEIII